MGIGNKKIQWVPTPISPVGGHPIQVAMSSDHSLILDDDHSLYGCGLNLSGQLGLGHFRNQMELVKNNLMCGKIVRIACGETHSMALLSDGSLYSWGQNSSGQLGIGSKEKN
uniref:Uncharacterized protein n=1 Tax=Arcella intermedia TaxID=1963864 RepID=A0A6B2LS24_9EUKA